MRGDAFFLIMPILSHSKMFLVETNETNITNTNQHLGEPEKGTDYWDDSYEYNEYDSENSDEGSKSNIYDDDDVNGGYEYGYEYSNEVSKEAIKLSASTCRPRRGMGRDVTLKVNCGDRVSIDCDLPRHGGCISRFSRSERISIQGQLVFI